MHNAHKYTEIRIGKEDMHRNAQKANIYNEFTPHNGIKIGPNPYTEI